MDKKFPISEWLTLEDAAKYLKIGRSKLYELASAARIPAHRIDKQWRFNTRDLDAWLAGPKAVGDYFTAVTANIEDNPMLRDPQKEAYRKVYDFYRSGGKIALVQLPVGCGKSGLAAIAPFGIAEGRVLVVTPNTTIRDEVRDNLDITHRKCFLRRVNILSKADMAFGPYVATLETGNVSVTDDSHFVVTNVQQLVTNTDKWLAKFPRDYFDMIIVDEAHHSAAASWQKVYDHFPKAKILHLTATPFRSDAQEVEGERIYRYPFRSAMAKGYIKHLTAVYVSPQEVELTFKGEDQSKLLSLADVLKYKDEEWFSKGIAMADECNKSIVDNSIEKVEILRHGSAIKHQIIAVAMSIPHAEKIKLLYEERGLEAAVIHSKMAQEDQEKVLRDLRSNALDVIVQVLKLGEGFDHPPLSVAAIFRPYRSLSPYLQFVGRIMRVNTQNAPRDPDNYGFIVTHIGMNLDALLQEFRLFEKDDEEFWAAVTSGEEPEEPPLERGTGEMRALTAPMVVHGEIADSLFEEPFVEDDAERIKEMRDQLEALGYDPNLAEEIVASGRTRATTTPATDRISVQPQRELERLRRQLTIELRAKSRDVVANCGLRVAGMEVPRKLMPGVIATNNLVAVIVMLNREVNKQVSTEPRDAWSREEFKLALEKLPAASINIMRQILAAKGAADA